MTSSGGDDAVLRYLAALEARRAAPADWPDPDDTAERIATAPMAQPAVDQEEHAVAVSGDTPGSATNLELLEDEFVAAAADYGRDHQMTYAAWREAGVDPEVLARAGISPEQGGLTERRFGS